MEQGAQAKISAVARRMLTGWDARSEQPLVGASGKHQQQLAVVHGLSADVHYLAAPALDLLDAGSVLAAMPLVRVCYESAVTAQWVAQTRDGSAAFINEDLRQRRAYVKTMEAAASKVFRESAPDVARVMIEDLETTASARRFDLICDDLTPGGKDAYLVYRSMSHMSHPTVLVADQYLEAIEQEPFVALRLHPKEPDGPTWTHMLAASLVWAGRAVDYMDKEGLRRSELRAAARDLGITSELRLTAAAALREASAR